MRYADYEVCYGDCIIDLRAEVKKLLAMGFAPSGGIGVATWPETGGHGDSVCLYQAMYRPPLP